uniref:Retrovirus-related Pol polyprotein from transposon TNT 1-94 n=1 Tax=Tanacetum cinerariifolium TaxID=118510 RepID=A0A6L2MW11_TANCI|nr:hypothetical protein [Tanacetum cinerariifolium]
MLEKSSPFRTSNIEVIITLLLSILAVLQPQQDLFSMSSPFQPKLLYLSEHKPKAWRTKDFKAKYNKVKAKLALLSSSASALGSSSGKNKGLIAKTYDKDEEEVSYDDNEVTEVKALMALTDEERVFVGKESANNGEWVKISIQKCISEQIPTQKKKILGINQLTEDTSSFRPKDSVFIKTLTDNSDMSITGSNKPKLSGAKDFTLLNHDTASKTNSAPAGKLKNMKIEDDPPLAIVMKELNELKLQFSKNKLSYFKNKNSQLVPPNALQNKYKT